jgi:hypothetical protein
MFRVAERFTGERLVGVGQGRSPSSNTQPNGATTIASICPISRRDLKNAISEMEGARDPASASSRELAEPQTPSFSPDKKDLLPIKKIPSIYSASKERLRGRVCPSKSKAIKVR